MAMVMRLAPFFPARVLSGDGIEVIRTGGSMIVAMNWDNIQQASLPVDPENYEFTLRNEDDGTFIRVPVEQVILPQVTWSTLSGKPSTFPPSAHTHPISEINLLQAALDSKVNTADTIATTKGGTGLTSYATGDLIYASGANTLAKRAAGTNGYILTMVAGVPEWAAAPTATTGTVVNTRTATTATTSGTAQNFTLSGSGIKRVRVMLNGVSTSGTNLPIVQLGTGGAPTTSGYAGAGTNLPNAGAITTTNETSGAQLAGVWGAALVIHGWIEFTLLDASTNRWAWVGSFGAAGGGSFTVAAGSVALSGALNYVRLTTVGGTDTFDLGSFSVEYDTTL